MLTEHGIGEIERCLMARRFEDYTVALDEPEGLTRSHADLSLLRVREILCGGQLTPEFSCGRSQIQGGGAAAATPKRPTVSCNAR
jgi:hypothetical protein